MTKSAIVLAGGFGTRLRSVVKEIPKPMAPVKGRPFLAFVLDYLNSFGLEKVVLSVGYKYEVILEYFGYQYQNIELIYSIEHQPLGTGGAIYKGSKLIQESSFFVLNGDSLFKINLAALHQFAIQQKASVALSLKEMYDFDRYGIVERDVKDRVIAFKEKQAAKHGFINGGFYWLQQSAFDVANFPTKFSFEKEFLEKYTSQLKMYAAPLEGYFIDIGIPTDYAKAQIDF